MGKAHLTAVAADAAFGLASVIIVAQDPGQKPAGHAPAQGRADVQNAPSGVHSVHIHG